MKENQTRTNCIYAQLNIGKLVQMKKIKLSCIVCVCRKITSDKQSQFKENPWSCHGVPLSHHQSDNKLEIVE